MAKCLKCGNEFSAATREAECPHKPKGVPTVPPPKPAVFSGHTLEQFENNLVLRQASKHYYLGEQVSILLDSFAKAMRMLCGNPDCPTYDNATPLIPYEWGFIVAALGDGLYRPTMPSPSIEEGPYEQFPDKGDALLETMGPPDREFGVIKGGLS